MKSPLLRPVHRLWLIAVAAFVAALPCPASAVADHGYDFVDLREPGGLGTAHGINRRGDVVGASRAGAFLYRSGRGSIRLPGLDAAAYDVTNGRVVVGVARASAEDLSGGAVLWQPDRTMRVLGPVPYGRAFAVSEAGHVAGHMSRNAQFRGFLYKGGAVTELAPHAGGSSSFANDVNNKGQVVGTASSLAEGTKAALWAGGGAPANLGSLGGNFSAAYAINEKGKVVGYSHTADSSSHAFLSSGGMQDLGTLPGDVGSFANDINEHGEIVGESRGVAGDYRAVLWKKNGSITDLNDFLPVPSLILTNATAINDRGDITGSLRRHVGGGRFRYGAFLLKHQLRADPGGPYMATRAEPKVLDGSRSTPANKITKITRYDWTFKPGDSCPERQKLANTKVRETEPKTTVVALCDLTVRLKVTDRDGGTHAAGTTLTVQRRANEFILPPLAHREEPLSIPPARPHRLTPTRQPWRVRSGVKWIVGINLSDCAPQNLTLAQAQDSILCPYVADARREGHGYQVKPVNNAHGPFDNFWYVLTTGLSIERVVLYNPWMRPDGWPIQGPGIRINWQRLNQVRGFGVAVANYWSHVRAHEGWGLPGRPMTGHTGAIAELVKQGRDPRRAIEPVFARTKARLTRFVNRRLARVERELDRLSADPLERIWEGELAHPKPSAFFGTKVYAVPEY